MRPVEKGASPKVYTDYSIARHDLANRIGYFCSYCEMKVYNSIEVEHVLPQNQGGNSVDWSNFLLSCKYCNTIKSDHNGNLSDYVWPDRDNTDLVFDYSEAKIIEPKTTMAPTLYNMAVASINLMGLDRVPGGVNRPTEADTRWRSREEVWTIAKESYNNWLSAPILQMALQIASTSLISGHYSIWCEIFKKEILVLTEIDNKYTKKGLFKQRDAIGNRIIRPSAYI
jgi:hypothetical protein